MRSLQDRGRPLSLPESNLGVPPPSPPSMVEPLWGTWASPRWSERAGRRQDAQPVQAPAKPGSKRRCKRP